MPGSIHVSVLDFSELPSSSPTSSILVKASMGKSDYQTWGKGDLSLPLKTLRDNVKITIHDADGNELSQAGVQTISIVEKGSLDESLSLKGGGTVRLKLLFVLNEEERSKIRRVRESAMKRKCDELLAKSPRDFKIASNAHGTITPSSYANQEVSDSQAIVAQNEILGIRDQVIEHQRRNGAYLKEINPNEADGSDTSQALQLQNDEDQKKSDEKIETREVNYHRLVDKIEKEKDQINVSNTFTMKDDSLNEKIGTSIERHRGFIEKNAKEMPQIDAPKTPIITNQANQSEDTSSLFSISRRVYVDYENLSKNQNRSEENNALKLDRINFRKRTIKSDDASPNFKAKKPVAALIEKREMLQKTSSNVRKMISAFESNLFKPVIKPPPINTQPEKVEIEAPKDQDSEDNTKPKQVEEPSPDEKSKPIEKVEEIETITKNDQELGKMLTNEEPNQNNSLNLLAPEEGICDTCEDSIGKIEHEFSSAMDTKQVKDLAVKCSIEERLSQRFSVSENMDKDINKSGIYTDENKIGKIKSSNESSPEGGPFPGQFGQGIKIAIMVAFGALILLTRQRKPSTAVKREEQREKRNRWEG